MNVPLSPKSSTTGAYYAQAVLSFTVSSLAVVIGIAFLPVDPWVRAFLGLGLLYTVSSAFTLAKVIRDRQEESAVTTRVDRARVDKLIAEHDPFKVDVG